MLSGSIYLPTASFLSDSSARKISDCMKRQFGFWWKFIFYARAIHNFIQFTITHHIHAHAHARAYAGTHILHGGSLFKNYILFRLACDCASVCNYLPFMNKYCLKQPCVLINVYYILQPPPPSSLLVFFFSFAIIFIFYF